MLAYVLQRDPQLFLLVRKFLANHVMNIACSPAQAVGKLVIQIQNLVMDPDFPLKTPERSPLFQIAAHLEIPRLCPPAVTHTEITNKTFADIRQEALRPRKARARRKRSAPRASFTDDNRQPQPI
jgi:hypothetical protein